jgi:hypothetical protein
LTKATAVDKSDQAAACGGNSDPFVMDDDFY